MPIGAASLRPILTIPSLATSLVMNSTRLGCHSLHSTSLAYMVLPIASSCGHWEQEITCWCSVGNDPGCWECTGRGWFFSGVLPSTLLRTGKINSCPMDEDSPCLLALPFPEVWQWVCVSSRGCFAWMLLLPNIRKSQGSSLTHDQSSADTTKQISARPRHVLLTGLIQAALVRQSSSGI